MKTTDVKKSLLEASIHDGDTLMIHGDAAVAYQLENEQFKKRLKIFFYEVIDYLGPNGTLIIPTFSYSFTKNEVFDISKTKSCLGSFSEFFRNFSGVIRSRHPIFSVVAIGKNQKLFADSHINDCFGRNTCFDLLHKLNGKVMNLGCNFDITYTHYVEQKIGVSYRYFKNFNGTIKIGKDTLRCSTSYFVGKPTIKYKQSLNRLKNILLSKNKLRIVPFGRLASYTVSCKNFYKYAKLNIDKNKYFLIQEGDIDEPGFRNA